MGEHMAQNLSKDQMDAFKNMGVKAPKVDENGKFVHEDHEQSCCSKFCFTLCFCLTGCCFGCFCCCFCCYGMCCGCCCGKCAKSPMKTPVPKTPITEQPKSTE